MTLLRATLRTGATIVFWIVVFSVTALVYFLGAVPSTQFRYVGF